MMMKKLFFAFSIMAMVGFTAVSCDKDDEKVCTCTTVERDDDGNQVGDKETDQVTIDSGSCSDLNETNEEPITGNDITKTCKEA